MIMIEFGGDGMNEQSPEQRDSIQEVLARINEDLSCFIRQELEVHDGEQTVQKDFGEMRWDAAFGVVQPINCWEAHQCGKSDCPAHGNITERCWLVAGTLCNGRVQGELASKFKSCQSCNIYKEAHDQPVRSLLENIHVLVVHLQGKARKLHELSIRDGLTGLYNRRFFDEVINHQIVSARRQSMGLALLAVDVDKFKTLNDQFGHQAGDQVLVDIAQLLQDATRSSDLIFRMGGDEFLILLTQLADRSLNEVLSRIEGAVERWNSVDHGMEWKMGLSLGPAPVDSDDIEHALARADEAMYAHKAKKRVGRVG
uniref:diguanylate cyclase n=1 Tax=Magnetococcus massalia (strain MO-1) TaxID=451514 RepID=A0A1S7LJ00_MAGMO|nr:putative Diguanylate kinase [Candidatus Magnetococcus massalia]